MRFFHVMIEAKFRKLFANFAFVIYVVIQHTVSYYVCAPRGSMRR